MKKDTKKKSNRKKKQYDEDLTSEEAKHNEVEKDFDEKAGLFLQHK